MNKITPEMAFKWGEELQAQTQKSLSFYYQLPKPFPGKWPTKCAYRIRFRSASIVDGKFVKHNENYSYFGAATSEVIGRFRKLIMGRKRFVGEFVEFDRAGAFLAMDSGTKTLANAPVIKSWRANVYYGGHAGSGLKWPPNSYSPKLVALKLEGQPSLAVWVNTRRALPLVRPGLLVKYETAPLGEAVNSAAETIDRLYRQRYDELRNMNRNLNQPF